MNLETTVTILSDSDDYDPIISFTAELNGNIIFNFSPESPGTKKQWKLLLEACMRGMPYCIDWAPSNGEAYIDFDGENVEFCVNKRGDGRGAEMSMKFSIKNWISQIEMIVKKLEENDEDSEEDEML